MKKIIIIIAVFAFANIANAQKTVNKSANKQSVKQDTTKQQPTYYLLGYQADFQLLSKALADHDNMTINQLKALATWVSQAQMIQTAKTDSTGKKND